MVRCTGKHFSQTAIVTDRFEFEIRVAEGIDDEITDEPRRHAEEIKVQEMVYNGQGHEKPNV